MSNIEYAKKLLKKAIEMQDDELIQLANDMMGLYTVPEEDKKHKRESDGTKGKDENFIFTMQSKTENVQSNMGGVPVNQIKDRTNQFYDDGIEAKDILTPDIKPTERKRPPFKMVEQKCEKCGKSVKTHPTHKRDYFVCDKCLVK